MLEADYLRVPTRLGCSTGKMGEKPSMCLAAVLCSANSLVGAETLSVRSYIILPIN